jgi:hypothetical protein
MAQPSTVVNVVGAQHHPGKLLNEIVVLISAFGRGDYRYLVFIVFG